MVRPSELGERELAAWRAIQQSSPSLQRGFLSPGFALACERAGIAAFVGVLHDSGAIKGFFPFQFRDVLHQRLGLADRIGGHFSDASGLVAAQDLRIDPAALLRLCRISLIHMDCLMQGQEELGLTGYHWEPSYVAEITGGPAGYFDGLRARNADFIRDTERRLRRTNKNYGEVRATNTDEVAPEVVSRVVEGKREQYRRTGVGDVFGEPFGLRLLDALRASADPDCRLHHSAFEAGGRLLAEHLGLRYQGALSWWFPIYDPNAQDVSPGRLLLWEMIRAADATAMSLIDFGEGEAQYKRQFSTGTVQMGRAMWSAGTVRAFAARSYQSLKWRLRKQPAKV